MTQMNSCAFCGNAHGLFHIDVPGEDDNDGPYRYYVCGKCWDVSSALARNAVASVQNKRLDEMARQMATMQDAMIILTDQLMALSSKMDEIQKGQ